MSIITRGLSFVRRNSVTVVGVLLSIFVATSLILSRQDTATSLLIGMAIAIITLIVEVIEKIDASKEKIIKVLSANSLMARDDALLDIISKIANDHEKIRHLDENLFRKRASQALLECRNVIHGLAEGRMVSGYEQRRVMYGARPQESVKLVVCVNQSFWRDRYGRRVMAGHDKAIKRGISFTHIWVDNRDELVEHRDTMEQLRDLGVNVRLALRDEVPRNLIKPYRIIDNRKLVRLEISVDGKDREQHIIIDKIEVEKAREEFDLLMQYTDSFEEFFVESK